MYHGARKPARDPFTPERRSEGKGFFFFFYFVLSKVCQDLLVILPWEMQDLDVAANRK